MGNLNPVSRSATESSAGDQLGIATAFTLHEGRCLCWPHVPPRCTSPVKLKTKISVWHGGAHGCPEQFAHRSRLALTDPDAAPEQREATVSSTHSPACQPFAHLFFDQHKSGDARIAFDMDLTGCGQRVAKRLRRANFPHQRFTGYYHFTAAILPVGFDRFHPCARGLNVGLNHVSGLPDARGGYRRRQHIACATASGFSSSGKEGTRMLIARIIAHAGGVG